MRRKIKILSLVAVFMSLIGFSSSAHALLSNVGPVNPANCYPVSYGDFVGRNLDLCHSQTVSPNVAVTPGDPSATYMCVLLSEPGFNANAPVFFPTNFPSESFYFIADADPDDPITGLPVFTGVVVTAMRFALEAGFGPGSVVDGQQMVFARIRFKANITTPGTYRVTHPYGVSVFPGVPTGQQALFDTVDVGLTPLVFTTALGTDIGPFLVWTPDPARTLTVGTETFIGDPNISHTVTGSPFGTNFVRFEVQPNGVGAFQNLGQTNNFFLSGKIASGAIPTPLTVDRASYTRDAAGAGHIDVFASAVGSVSLQVSGVGIPTTPMGGDPLTGKFYAQIPFTAATTLPASVTVTNLTDVPNTLVQKSLTDEVTIQTATFEYNSRTLSLAATSSDALAPVPSLSSPAYGPLTAGALTVTPVFVPPASTSVVSSKGGSETLQVSVLNPVGTPPTAVNDVATIAENTVLVPTSLLNFSIRANDTPIPPAALVVTLLNGPAHGTVVNNGDGTVNYTPTVNFSGTDSFAYVVRDAANLYSNPALVTITITPVNSAPVAVADAATTSAGSPVLINVLANDSDPDGTLNPASVTIVTGPVNGSVVVNTANGRVTYTPNAGFVGTNTFTYTVRDNLTALSNVATVTVTVTPVVTTTETLRVLKAEFRAGTWNISGSSNFVGATVTIRIGSVLTGAVIGTATRGANGSWAFAGTSTTVPNPGVFRTISVQSTGLGSVLAFPLLVR